MISVNGKFCQWKDGGTVAQLLEQKQFTYPIIIVRINNIFIRPEDYGTKEIYAGDDVQVIHLMAGG